MWHGDIRLGDTIDIKFTTVDTSGVPTTLAGTPVVSAYPGNSTTELTAGITLTVDFDARTGLHNVRVVATSGNGYATATNYVLVITTGTVGGTSVVGYCVGSFSIEARSAVMPTTAARTLDVSATGEAGVDWANIGAPTTVVNLSGTSTKAVEPTTAGRTLDVSATGEAGIDWANIGAPTTAQTLSGTTVGTATALGAGAVSAAAVATGAIDADALATDAVTEIRSVASGTSDSGTTTTMVDAVRTEADTDYWKGDLILFTSGTISGECRLITAFDPATDTITFAPATTQAVATQTYEILPAGRADLQLVLGTVLNALIAGRIDANAQVVGDKTGYALGAGGIANTAFAAGAIDAAAIAANALGASELAQDAAQEVADEVLNRDLAGGASGGARIVRDALRALRNKVAESGGTATVYQEDDATTAWTAAVTRTASTNAITTVDPA